MLYDAVKKPPALQASPTLRLDLIRLYHFAAARGISSDVKTPEDLSPGV